MRRAHAIRRRCCSCLSCGRPPVSGYRRARSSDIAAGGGTWSGRAGAAGRLARHPVRPPPPPVLVGHGAGALVALEAARAGVASAAVLVAPLVPGSTGVRTLTRRWDALAALALGRAIPPPRDAAARRVFGEVPAGVGGASSRGAVHV